MGNAKGFITLRQLVEEMNNDRNWKDKDHYRRYMQFIIRAISSPDLSFIHRQSVNVAYLQPTDLNICQLPEDFVDYEKIGFEVNGRIWTFTRNDTIAFPIEEECGSGVREWYSNDDVDTIISLPTVPFITHVRDGEVIDTMFGISGGYNYNYYRIDYRRGLLYIDGAILTTKVVLEYQSSGISMSGDTYVPLRAKEAILAYAHWLRVENDDNYPYNEKERKKQNKKDAIQLLAGNILGFTADEFLDIIRSCYKQTPKR